MNYPLRYPASLLLSRLGATITMKIDVIHDKEANVYVATSQDITGLVLEAKTFDEIIKESEDAIPALLELNYPEFLIKKPSADVIFTDHLAVA